MVNFKKQLIILLCLIFFLNLLFGSEYLFFYKENFSVPFWLFTFLVSFCLVFFFFTILSLTFKKGFGNFLSKINPEFFRFIIFFIGLFFLFFWFGFSLYTFLLFILLLLIFWEGSRKIEKGAEDDIKFSFFKALENARPFFVNGIALLIAFLFFLSPKIFGGKIFLPRPVYDVSFPEIEKVVKNKYPAFSGEMNINEFVFLMVIENPPENFPLNKSETEAKTYSELKQVFQNFKKKVGEKETDLFLEKSRFQVLKSFGFSEEEIKKVKGDEKINEFLYQLISNWIEEKLKTYQYFLGGVAGILIFSFLVVKLLLTIPVIIFLPLLLILFNLLKKVNFIKINLVKVDKEEIEI